MGRCIFWKFVKQSYAWSNLQVKKER